MIVILKKWIINIVTAIIFISFIEILMPNSKMKKYLNLVLGLLVILVIMNPVIELIKSKTSLEEEFFKITRDLNREEYVFATQNIEMKQKKQLISIYKSKIKNEIKNIIEEKFDIEVLDVDVIVEENKHERIGEIKEIKLSLSTNRPKDSNNINIPVVSINISKDDSSHITDSKEIEDELKSKIKDVISNVYNVGNSKVIIN